MSGRGSKRGVGGPLYRQNTRNRGVDRGPPTKNAPHGTYTIEMTKKLPKEVAQQNPYWVVNALDCAEQIATHHGIQLTSIPAKMRAAITASITTTVHHCKTLPIPVNEEQKALERRTPEDHKRQYWHYSAAFSYPPELNS